MRALIASRIACALVAVAASTVASVAACDSERAGIEAARRQAAEQEAAKAKDRPAVAVPARPLATPVPGQAHVPCSQLIDARAFAQALGEKQPLTVKDVTRTRPDAAASCSLTRGGKRPGEAEQLAIAKRNGRLGVLPGDEVCNVTAYCWTIEELDRFKARCKEHKDRDDESIGSYACVHTVATGATDVSVYQLFDEDTRCILKIGGGPSNIDNEQIRLCAKTARDTIGPAQIHVDTGDIEITSSKSSGQ